MKHPSLKQLQDYFEHESSDFSEDMMRQHIEDCQQCSLVLAQMAKVDILFSKSEAITVSEETKEKVFSQASELLALKKNQIKAKQEQADIRKEKIQDTLQSIRELKESALSELKIPALQTVAISTFLIVLTKFATTHTTTENYQIINDDVQVISSELSGEEDEIY